MATAAILLGCGSPYETYFIERETIVTEGSDAGVTRVSLDVRCQEYAERNEAAVCDGEELCVTAHWVDEAYELDASFPGGTRRERRRTRRALSSRTLAEGTVCQTYTTTPQSLTFVITPESAPPAAKVRQLVVQGVSGSRNIVFTTPMTLEGEIYQYVWEDMSDVDAGEDADAEADME